MVDVTLGAFVRSTVLALATTALSGCVSLGADVLELCDETIESTPPIEVISADVKETCIDEPNPTLCARAKIRELRAASLSAAASVGRMADYYLDLAWGVDPSVEHGLRSRCPLAREHLLELVNGLDALLREVDHAAFWNPPAEPNEPEDGEKLEVQRASLHSPSPCRWIAFLR